MKRVLTLVAVLCASALCLYLFVSMSSEPNPQRDPAILDQAKPDDGPKTFKRGEIHNTGRDQGF